MVRTLIIISLLASLFYIVQHWQPAPEPAGKVIAANQATKPAEEAKVETPNGFNPVVPEALPDVEKGYIFAEKRKIEKEPPPGAVKPEVVEPGPEVLDSVNYVGSLIIGDTRRALVTYQEPAKDPGGPGGPGVPGGRRPAPIGRRPPPPDAASQGASQNKQLVQGDRLLGYQVGLIEPSRIVFEKGEQKVEKFLYDRKKKRMEAVISRPENSPAAAPGGVQPDGSVTIDVTAAAAVSPDGAQRPGGGAVVTPLTGAGAAGQAAVQSGRMLRRSQRLLGADPSISVPTMPVPGRPIPKN